MWNRQDIKATGKAAFKANYWKCVLAAILLTLLAAGSSRAVSQQTQSQTNADGSPAVLTINGMPAQNLPPEALIGIAIGVTIVIAVALLLRIFIFNPLKIGCYAFFKNNVLQPGAPLDTIMEGFKDYSRTFITLLLTDLYTALWSMLFFIPGLIKAYSYRMVPYILRDNPELSANQAITRSREMMNGHKMNAFIYDLSFIGWYILEILTLGIAGVFWVSPYKYSSDAALYLAIKDQG